jgi:hypothetical protein
MLWQHFADHLLANPFAVAVRVVRASRVIFPVGRSFLAVEYFVGADIAHRRARALAAQGNVLRADPVHAQGQFRLAGAAIHVGQRRAVHHKIRLNRLNIGCGRLISRYIDLTNIDAFDFVTACRQFSQQPPADIAICAGDQDSHRSFAWVAR